MKGLNTNTQYIYSEMLKYTDLIRDEKHRDVKFDTPSMDAIMLMKKKAKPKPLQTDVGDESLFQMCRDCGANMEQLQDEFNLTCSKCSANIEIGNVGEHTIGAGEHHNTSKNSYMSFKPTGIRQAGMYQHAMVKYTSEYETLRDSQIRALIKRYDFVNPDFHLPSTVLNAAADLFIQLKAHDYVRRGMCRRGVLGACVFVECQRAGISKTATQIAKMMNVEESKITFGRQELQRYHNNGVINIPQNIDPTAHYVDCLFEIFDIPVQYKKWVIDMLERIDKHRIPEIYSCFTNTKCVGVVYALSQLVGLNITHPQIASKCGNICRGTYLNVWSAIIKNEDILRKCFEKHQMPVPTGWKPLAVAKK